MLYALCAWMCLCPKPTWQHLPLFVPQCGGQIDIDSVRGQTNTQTPPSPPSPNTVTNTSPVFLYLSTIHPPFTPPSEEEDLDPPFLPSSSLILSQLEAAKQNRNAEYSMLTFLTIRSYHKDVELTSVNMLNCLYVSLACLSCMYNNV